MAAEILPLYMCDFDSSFWVSCSRLDSAISHFCLGRISIDMYNNSLKNLLRGLGLTVEQYDAFTADHDLVRAYKIPSSSKDDREMVKRFIKIMNATLWPSQRIGLNNYELSIELIKRRISKGTARIRSCSCGDYRESLAYKNDLSVIELKITKPYLYRLREAVAKMLPGRVFDIDDREYPDLPMNDAQLKDLQANLSEPIFIYGANCDVVFTATQLEEIWPNLKGFKAKFGYQWYDPALAIRSEYPNIHCLFCQFKNHYAIINS